MTELSAQGQPSSWWTSAFEETNVVVGYDLCMETLGSHTQASEVCNLHHSPSSPVQLLTLSAQPPASSRVSSIPVQSSNTGVHSAQQQSWVVDRQTAGGLDDAILDRIKLGYRYVYRLWITLNIIHLNQLFC